MFEWRSIQVGVRNRQRRAAKAKDRKRRVREHEPRDFLANEDLIDLRLVTRARWVRDTVSAALHAIDLERPEAPITQARTLAEATGNPGYAPLINELLVELVSDQVPPLWRRGWQPADVTHVLRRLLKITDLTLAMAADAMAAHLATLAPATVDERFSAQLIALDADPTAWHAAGFVARWTERMGVSSEEVIGSVLVLADALRRLPSIGVLGPLPGQTRHRPTAGAAAGDQRMLERVRGLLAKAESTAFDAEADTLTAKAQELMARYSIDHALLAVGPTPEEPGGIRIAVDKPYEAEKAMLLDQVAQANRCRAIRSSALGLVTVLGFPADLRAVEVLYTSLLVQVTRALLREGSRPTGGGGNRTVAFRRSFQQAFAVRIGERLGAVAEASVREGATDDESLLPVLVGREQAVRRFAEGLFPDVVEQRMTGGYDREGWALGTHSADLAPLTTTSSLPG